MADTTKHTVRISAPPDDVNTVHDLLEDVWSEVPDLSSGDRDGFETALIELASNVLRHAQPGSGISCTLTIRTFPDYIDAILSDTGDPGEVELLARPMPHDLAESGRGIALIQALVDTIEYDRIGELNHWRISRKRNR